MELRRSSDNYLLCNEISRWSGWKPMYNAEVYPTVENVPYFYREGVMLKVQEIRCAFSDGFPGATEDRYWKMVECDRKTRACKFTDSKGATTTVLIYEKQQDEDREEEIRSEDIRYVTLMLAQTRYFA